MIFLYNRKYNFIWLESMRIVTWNIGGGIKYGGEKEDKEYLLKTVSLINPDIVCLQESHINVVRSLAKDIFSEKFEYISEYPISVSHNDPAYQLALTILSKKKIDESRIYMLENPKLSRVLDSGKTIYSHDKGIQEVRIEDIYVANVQLLPLHVFKTTYDEQPKLSHSIDNFILSNLHTPLIFLW